MATCSSRAYRLTGRRSSTKRGFGLWKLDTASGQVAEIRIDIKSDLKSNDVELRTIQSEAEAFSLSPSNKRAAISTHGEIFTIATDRGDVQRVTESCWREQEPRWSPNGKWIAFISDRTGREQVWISDERGKTVKQLSDADCDKGSIVWAPDSKSLLWAGSDHKLRRVEIESGSTEQVASSDAGPIGLPQFSPDGKWISYSKQDELLRSHVYVKQLDGGVERMIGSDEFLIASSANWTGDGKKLVMLGGDRHAGDGVAQPHDDPALQRAADQDREEPGRGGCRFRGAGRGDGGGAARAGVAQCSRRSKDRMGWAGSAHQAAHADVGVGLERGAVAGWPDLCVCGHGRR